MIDEINLYKLAKVFLTSVEGLEVLHNVCQDLIKENAKYKCNRSENYLEISNGATKVLIDILKDKVNIINES